MRLHWLNFQKLSGWTLEYETVNEVKHQALQHVHKRKTTAEDVQRKRAGQHLLVSWAKEGGSEVKQWSISRERQADPTRVVQADLVEATMLQIKRLGPRLE
ncbi:peptidyl-prolyl cis-trans isomerase /cyclophilin-40 (CYP40) / rotamase, partial [Striga asiatica]